MIFHIKDGLIKVETASNGSMLHVGPDARIPLTVNDGIRLAMALLQAALPDQEPDPKVFEPIQGKKS